MGARRATDFGHLCSRDLRHADEQREAATAKRLDQIDRKIARIERDVGISVETLAQFIQF